MKSFYRATQLLRSRRPQLTLVILALVGYVTAYAALPTLAEVSFELAQISLSLCQMGLVAWRVFGI
jgi:hypothetical protein